MPFQKCLSTDFHVIEIEVELIAVADIAEGGLEGTIVEENELS